MPLNAAQLLVRVNADTTAAQAGIKGFATLLGPGGLLGLGLIGAGVAVAGIGIASVKMAGDFQAGMTTLVTGAGEAQSNLGLVSAGVLQMARDTGTSTKQLVEGLYMIESAGYHGQTALDVLKAAAEGAKVGNADLGTTADAVTTIMKDYSSAHVSAAQATNTLIATVAQGKTHMQDLAGALSAVLPAAQTAGIGLNDVMAAMAAQTAAGIPAADAATHLRQMIIALEAPSKQAEKALRSVGLSSSEVAAEMHKSLPGAVKMITDAVGKKFPVGSSQYLQAIKEISGGSREMQGILALSGSHMGEFAADAAKLAGAAAKGGSQITGWNLVQGTFNQKMDKLREVVETLLIGLGTKLLPIAGELADLVSHGLSGAFDLLNGKSDALTKRLGGDLVSAATQLGGFIKGTLLPVITSLAKFFVQHVMPVLAVLVHVIVTDVLPVILNLAHIILTKWLPPLQRIIGDVLPVLIPLLKLLGWVFSNIIGPVLGQIGNLIGWLLGKIADLFDGISHFIQSPAVQSFLKVIGGAVGGAAKGIGGLFAGLPHFAEGGEMEHGGLALVGERGPELVRLPGGARIAPLGSVNSLSALPGALAGLGRAAQLVQVQTAIYLDGRKIGYAVSKHIPHIVGHATGARAGATL